MFLDGAGANQDGQSDEIRQVQDDSLEQDEIDDISSMASDFPKFRAKRLNKKRKRAMSGSSSSMISGAGSDTSSEMAAISDNEDDVREAILRRHSVLRQNKINMST